MQGFRIFDKRCIKNETIFETIAAKGRFFLMCKKSIIKTLFFEKLKKSL
jgi:hypothetical protein